MIDGNDSVEARLARLGAATAGLRPRLGFEERVLAAVSIACEADWWMQLVRFGRAGLIAGVLAASVAAFVAVESQRAGEAASAVAYGTLEIDW